MQKIKFGKRKFRFITSFDGFTLKTIKVYMNVHDDIESLITESTQKLRKLENINDDLKKIHEDINQIKKDKARRIIKAKSLGEQKKIERVCDTKIEKLDAKFNDLDASMLLIDAELTELQFEITGKRIDLLCALCLDDDFKAFIENTSGITRGHINVSIEVLLKELCAFTNYWNDCPAVESFKMKVPGKLLKQKFKVHEMDKTTLVRETLASVQAQKALNFKAQLDAGSFENICRFIAILVRPSDEKEEISHTQKSFISGKRLKGLQHSEKLALYLEELEETWKKREVVFENLPLSVGIGVLKCYFEKKNL